MSVLSHLTPQPMFDFFEQMCAIPHGSGNTKAISDWCVEFAKVRNLRWRQDEHNNVVIWKDGTPGYENAPAVILQGHLDMVCAKDEQCKKDMAVEGLDLFIDGDLIGARGTSLGGDDGIAVAMALAILDSKDIPHPPIEAVLTVDEEVGLVGA
ncbi:MAG: M20/M25/M40 family metallo-hydrolase, partial [Oscillospiraceae bacterium]|nr:M20/M25/M40 family metallo-hydrolase [Oscillospiraceae bacterium]